MMAPAEETSPGRDVWPGLFSVGTLHRVQPRNATRLAADDGRYGMADCGAACIPRAAPRPGPRTRCPKCFPEWPTRTPEEQP